MMRQICQAGLDLTRGYETCVLFSYDDHYFPPRRSEAGLPIIGNLTVGYGHCGKDVFIGEDITADQAEELFEEDTGRAAAVVERDASGIALTDNQFAALADFVFRVGIGHFESSTLLKDLLSGDFADVPGQIARWNMTGGRQSAGLVSRAAAEVRLWNEVDAIAA